jgi:hypothetical protein
VSKFLPIRKVAAAGVAFVITYAAQRVGLHLGSDAVSDLAQGAVMLGAAWAAKDPRVQSVVEGVEVFASEYPAITAEVHELADAFVKAHEDAFQAVDAAYANAHRSSVSLAQAASKVRV